MHVASVSEALAFNCTALARFNNRHTNFHVLSFLLVLAASLFMNFLLLRGLMSSPEPTDGIWQRLRYLEILT